jgi:hypothetical protein
MANLVKFTSLINYTVEKMNPPVFGSSEYLFRRTPKSRVKYFVRLVRTDDSYIAVTKYIGKKFKFNIFMCLQDKKSTYNSIEWALDCKDEQDIESNYKAIKELSYRLFGTV